MDALLRRLAEWKGKRKAAQIIIFDGAAEVDKTRSFLKGVCTGAGAAVLAFALAGPVALDNRLLEELQRREALLRDSNSRADQAMRVADVCLTTAQNLERTLAGYQAILGNRGGAGPLAPLPFASPGR
jgi:hypothetical protein